jgi:hypothetical protein
LNHIVFPLRTNLLPWIFTSMEGSSDLQARNKNGMNNSQLFIV